MLVLGTTAFTKAVANNMVVTNVVLVNQNRDDKTVEIKFDLKWDNSWRAPCSDPAYTNWDAAWVFIKFRVPNSSTWEHAKLSVQNADHTPAMGSTIDVGATGADGVGAFIYSAGPYTGAVNYAGTRLKWNYGANGYSFPTGSSIDLSVAAIEMVYVPQGSFYVGSGGSEDYCFTEGSWRSGVTIPFQITSEDQILYTNAAGCLWANTNGPSWVAKGTSGVVSNAFPKGYNAFYCMKYEVTQGQYTDFLNKLSPVQGSNRWSASASGYRYTVGTNSVGVFTNAAPDRACNFLSWVDGCAYADWTGLRPMTELEFEKACRGPANPVADEYVWGNTVATKITSEAGVSGSGTETPNPSTGNCNYNSSAWGPTRVGIFATATSIRIQAGASYWGIMELGGNVIERPVTVGNAAGRLFTGGHGDGTLAESGSADVVGWQIGGGIGYRGGSFTYTPVLSSRSNAAYSNEAWSPKDCGWRAVRSAP